LNRTRQAWVATLLAASQARCFQAGPLKDRDYIPTFFYWQALPQRIEEVLISPRAIDSSLLDELGATTKGLFALEYLLFGQKNAKPDATGKVPLPLELLAGSKRRGEFMLLLSHDVEAKAAQLAEDWMVPGTQGASAKFMAGGQESVNLLVNQLAMALEEATEHRLRFVLGLPHPISRQMARIEGSSSGTSQRSLLATFEGMRKFCLGAESLGLADALQPVNPLLEKKLRAQFEAVISALNAINAPLEQAVSDNHAALQAALEKARALEILFKVDLTSALGVTLTFSSTDGDLLFKTGTSGTGGPTGGNAG